MLVFKCEGFSVAKRSVEILIPLVVIIARPFVRRDKDPNNADGAAAVAAAFQQTK